MRPRRAILPDVWGLFLIRQRGGGKINQVSLVKLATNISLSDGFISPEAPCGTENNNKEIVMKCSYRRVVRKSYIWPFAVIYTL